MRILVAPAHFTLGEGSGSESETALKIIRVLAQVSHVTVIFGVKTGPIDLPKNITLIPLYTGSSFHPTPWARYRFLWDVTTKARCLLARPASPSASDRSSRDGKRGESHLGGDFDAVYHIFPFDRYHPCILTLLGTVPVPVVVGPVTVPHNLLRFPDEAGGFPSSGAAERSALSPILGNSVIRIARMVRPATTLLMQRSLRRVHTVIAESRAAKKYYSRWIKPSRITVIYNYLDRKLVPWRVPSGEESAIAVIGNLVTRKGVDRIIRCMPRIRARFPACTLFIIGDGPMRRELKHLSEVLSCDDSVVFTGRVQRTEVTRLLRKAAVVVSCAHEEAFPNTVLEAMALGIPTVSMRTVCSEELITHGKTGFIVEQGDEETLSAICMKLLGNTTLRRKVASAARDVVEKRFFNDQALHSYQSIFINLSKST